MGGIFGLLALALTIYYYLIIARVLLSWFQIDWYEQPYRGLRDITEPYLGLFKFIPPFGMLDFSPLVALVVLHLVKEMVAAMA